MTNFEKQREYSRKLYDYLMENYTKEELDILIKIVTSTIIAPCLEPIWGCLLFMGDKYCRIILRAMKNPIKRMPLYINSIASTFARWRLRIGR